MEPFLLFLLYCSCIYSVYIILLYYTVTSTFHFGWVVVFTFYLCETDCWQKQSLDTYFHSHLSTDANVPEHKGFLCWHFFFQQLAFLDCGSHFVNPAISGLSILQISPTSHLANWKSKSTPTGHGHVLLCCFFFFNISGNRTGADWCWKVCTASFLDQFCPFLLNNQFRCSLLLQIRRTKQFEKTWGCIIWDWKICN